MNGWILIGARSRAHTQPRRTQTHRRSGSRVPVHRITKADSVASIAIFILIIPRAWSLLRQVIDVLLEATPRRVDLDEVRRHIAEEPGVVDVHDLHAWTITRGVPVFTRCR